MRKVWLRNATIVALSAVGLVVASARIGRSQTPAAATASPLAKFAWLAGSWRAEHDGDRLDELWSEPEGDSMVGAFRWMKGGKVWMSEALSLKEEGGDVVMRIKHFDAKLVAWEEKAESVTFKLVRQEGQTADFERIGSDKPGKLNYRLASADTLQVRLDTVRDGKPKTEEFTFHRLGHDH